MMDPGTADSTPFLSYVSVVDEKRCYDAVRRSGVDERLRSHAEHGTTEDSHSCNGSRHGAHRSADRTPGACYTAALLKSTLLLMGCKPRVAHKVGCCTHFLLGYGVRQYCHNESLAVLLTGTLAIIASF